jgi:fibronectin-binding autotransporter adhesin
MNPSTSRFALRNLLLAAAASIAPLAHSATLFWDGTSSTANADGGAGTWDVSTLVWDTLATAGSDSAWVDGSDAVFGGATGTVTLSGSFSLNSLTINNGVAYTLTGGTLTLGGKTITTSGAGSSRDININSIIAGSGGITLAANGDTSVSGGGVG